MNTEWLAKLWNNNVLQLGVWETIYMTLLATLFAYLIGLPLGLLLRVTDTDGIHPIKWLNSVLGVIVNFLRSMPFISAKTPSASRFACALSAFSISFLSIIVFPFTLQY